MEVERDQDPPGYINGESSMDALAAGRMDASTRIHVLLLDSLAELLLPVSR